jgi:hypothetical protein
MTCPLAMCKSRSLTAVCMIPQGGSDHIPQPKLLEALHGASLLGLRHRELLPLFKPRVLGQRHPCSADDACAMLELAWLQHSRSVQRTSFSRGELQLLADTLEPGRSRLQTRSPYQLWQLCMALTYARIPTRCFSGPLAACNWDLEDAHREDGAGGSIFGGPRTFAVRIHSLAKAGAPAWILCAFLDVAVRRGNIFTPDADAESVMFLLQAVVKASRLWVDKDSTQVRAHQACTHAVLGSVSTIFK